MGYKSEIKIGARVSFEMFEYLEDTLNSVDFPIEFAFPWKYRLWLKIENRLSEILDILKKKKVEVLSIHATQARISEDSFLECIEAI